MRWSKSILKKEQAEKSTLEFTPQKFKLGTPSQALEYLREKSSGSDFRMNDVIRVQTGVENLEQKSEEQKIDEKTLEKLQMIQESAYAEAYRLGLDEGKKTAFEKASTEIEQRLGELDQLLATIRNLKTELIGHNESSLIGLMFQMASRLAMTELDQNNQAVVEVLRQAVHLAQDEERIHVQVAPSQFEFLEEIKKQTSRELDFLKVMTFDPRPGIRSGGCVIETNYGEIDARVEQRLEQLWAAISPTLPRVKNVIGG
jgi:flagellar assembly protein FliH